MDELIALLLLFYSVKPEPYKFEVANALPRFEWSEGGKAYARRWGRVAEYNKRTKAYSCVMEDPAPPNCRLMDENLSNWFRKNGNAFIQGSYCDVAMLSISSVDSPDACYSDWEVLSYKITEK